MISHLDWTAYVMTLYEKWRCHFCVDPLNQLADLSAGDPWLKEFAGRRGMNIVVSRSIEGKALLEHAKADGVVHLEAFSPNRLIQSQGGVLRRKRDLIWAYMSAVRAIGRQVPIYTGVLQRRPSNIRDYAEVAILEILRTMASIEVFQPVMHSLGKRFLQIRKIRHRAELS
jgi:hypothetical protein